MRFKAILAFLFFLPSILFSQANEKEPDFAHPMMIDPVALYNKVWFKQTYSSFKSSNDSRRDHQTAVEGELRLGENFSLVSSVGSTSIQRKEMGTVRAWDRFNLGFKSAWTFDTGLGLFLLGGGVRIFDKPKDRPELPEESQNLYAIRPNIGGGWKAGKMQLMGDLAFQSETNTVFRERFNEEFRRYGQLSGAFSYGITQSTRIFLETQIRKPWNKTIDAYDDFVMVAPGLSYATENWGTFGGSFGISLMEQRQYDSVLRFNYFYFF